MNVFLKPLVLVTTLSLMGCSPLMSGKRLLSTRTPTTATPGGMAKSKPLVCNTVWKRISYSAKLDTEQTVKEIRANNAAWSAYCGDVK